jgi:hypothetical protein
VIGISLLFADHILGELHVARPNVVHRGEIRDQRLDVHLVAIGDVPEGVVRRQEDVMARDSFEDRFPLSSEIVESISEGFGVVSEGFFAFGRDC